MAKLEELYIYQQADMRLDKFEAGLKGTPAYKRFVKMRAYIEEQRRTLQKMTAAVESRQKQIEITRQKCEVLEQRFGDGMAKYEAAPKGAPADIEKYRKYFEQLHARISQERREFSEFVSEIEKEDKLLTDMRAKLARARKEYDELSAQIEKERAEKQEELDKLEGAVKAASLSVSPELLERYRSAKKSHSMPVAKVVANKCGGCNMELPVVIMRRLKEDADFVECENCGRMLLIE